MKIEQHIHALLAVLWMSVPGFDLMPRAHAQAGNVPAAPQPEAQQPNSYTDLIKSLSDGNHPWALTYLSASAALARYGCAATGAGAVAQGACADAALNLAARDLIKKRNEIEKEKQIGQERARKLEEEQLLGPNSKDLFLRIHEKFENRHNQPFQQRKNLIFFSTPQANQSTITGPTPTSNNMQPTVYTFSQSPPQQQMCIGSSCPSPNQSGISGNVKASSSTSYGIASPSTNARVAASPSFGVASPSAGTAPASGPSTLSKPSPAVAVGTPNVASRAVSNAASNAASGAASNAASRTASTAASNAASRAASNAASRAASNAASNAASRAASNAASNAASRAASNAASNAASRAASNVRIPSDIRLKRDIVELGQLSNGLHLYRYCYIGDSERYVGVMAQEVAQRVPGAVVRGADGYQQVDYARLGIEFLTFDEWTARNAARARY